MYLQTLLLGKQVDGVLPMASPLDTANYNDCLQSIMTELSVSAGRMLAASIRYMTMTFEVKAEAIDSSTGSSFKGQRSLLEVLNLTSESGDDAFVPSQLVLCFCC